MEEGCRLKGGERRTLIWKVRRGNYREARLGSTSLRAKYYTTRIWLVDYLSSLSSSLARLFSNRI
ncbi:hypothetical protein CCACVL1_12344 [Corchorus capsularis]|uniref:Uncharacterized protein n=1 Tax=Corchorus capsularis TaxID=210143 RepID=A0A1R3IGA5_COCAP|nr:hypothetical protein CCACVL1_12344 [Corchorus capsularis]